jgi:chromosomal replication initiation ATPase DnaA
MIENIVFVTIEDFHNSAYLRGIGALEHRSSHTWTLDKKQFELYSEFKDSSSSEKIIDNVIKYISDYFSRDITVRSQENDYVFPRFIATYVCVSLTNVVNKMIAERLGYTNQTAVIYNKKRFRRLIDFDKKNKYYQDAVNICNHFEVRI